MTAPAHRPRVAFLGYAHDARGGIAQFGRRLAETVSDRADVRMIGYRRLYPSFTRPGRQPADPSRLGRGLAGERITVPWLPWTWRATSRHLADFGPDLLVVQWWTPLLGPSVRSILRRSRRAGTRTLVMVHNDRPHERFPLWRQITRATLGQADELAAFTQPVADAIRAMLPAAEPQVAPLPQSLVVMSEDEAVDWDARLGAPAGPVILFFGNVRAYKGLEDLVAAMPAVLERVDATLVVAGTFMEPLERYQEQVRALGVEHRVTLLPDYLPDEEVGGLFRRADVVALPYRHAPGSGVLGQAAQAGRPVVATAVGSLPELVGDRGVLVPPRDPQALAAGLVRALEDPPPPPAFDDGAWARWGDYVLATAGCAA
jgi:glycosyltransferase involved in cell wall biosynthesis